jgi:hypothetical protein
MNTVQWIADNGIYIHFGEKEPFILNSTLRRPLGGNAQIVKSAMQDGASTYITTLDQRNITVAFTAIAAGNSKLRTKTIRDEQSNLLSKAFLPKGMGWLVYQNGRGGQLIKARAITTPTVTGEGSNWVRYEVELLADSPYWHDSELHEIKIGDLRKLFSFPLTFPFMIGTYNPTSTINNPQSEEIKPLFEVYSVLNSLTITNLTTGAQMRVNRSIAENQKVIIDTAESLVSLYEDGVFAEDISNWLDGDFITLVKGGNVIKAENDVPDELPACKVFYRVPVWGV